MKNETLQLIEQASSHMETARALLTKGKYEEAKHEVDLSMGFSKQLHSEMQAELAIAKASYNSRNEHS